MGNTPKAFTEMLGELEGGRLVEEITEAVANMLVAVEDTRKPGSLSIQVKFAMTGKGTVQVLADFNAKEPKHDRESTSFFMDGQFNLHRRDPNQHEMPLRTHDAPRGEARPVDYGPAERKVVAFGERDTSGK